MRAPGFWDNPPNAPGLLARALAPFGALYAAATRRRLASATPYRAPVPVICIGNLTAGGAGKTPTAMAVLQALSARGVSPAALSRGYGGVERGPRKVDLATDEAARVGDEPLLLAGFAPVWVARDRAAGARAAVAGGAEALVMDDGHQNPSLAKDLSLVVVDAAQGFGNGAPIPAGPLREYASEGLARADAVVLIGAPDAAERFLRAWPVVAETPVLRARIEPLRTGLSLDGARVVAFAGIGRPEKFFATLRGMGADLVAAHAFPDHARYARPMLRRLLAEARAKGAELVTTEKDMARLPHDFRMSATALPVRLHVDDPAALEALLDRAFAAQPREQMQ